MSEQDDKLKAAQGALTNAMNAQQKFIADILTEKPTQVYRMDDYDTLRTALFDNCKNAVMRRFPLYNDRYQLCVEDIDYADPDKVPVDLQKKAVLERKSVTRRLRGRWVLKTPDGKVIAKTQPMTLMKVPYMTGRGTFIRNGAEYAFTNIMRLEPGVYARKKPDGIAAQFNIKQGTGAGFNMILNPSTGLFQIRRGTRNAPAYTVMKDLGVTDEQMKEAWGEELFNKNKAAGTSEKARVAADGIYNK